MYKSVERTRGPLERTYSESYKKTDLENVIDNLKMEQKLRREYLIQIKYPDNGHEYRTNCNQKSGYIKSVL